MCVIVQVDKVVMFFIHMTNTLVWKGRMGAPLSSGHFRIPPTDTRVILSVSPRTPVTADVARPRCPHVGRALWRTVQSQAAHQLILWRAEKRASDSTILGKHRDAVHFGRWASQWPPANEASLLESKTSGVCFRGENERDEKRG